MIMKHAKHFLLMAAMLLCSIGASAGAYFEVDGIWYETNDNSSLTVDVIAPKDGTKYTGDIVIPSRVEYVNNTWFVNSIKGFSNCQELTSVVIPSNVLYVYSAFANCSALTSITCNAVNPPIANEATFTGVNKATCIIYVPASAVDAYKADTYWGTFENIQPILIASGTCGNNLTWKLTEEGELLVDGIGGMTNYGPRQTPWYEHRTLIKQISMGAGVTSIGDYAFYGLTELLTVDISKKVSSIGNYAFYGCGKLTSVDIPTLLTAINYRAFSKCGLTSVTIPEGVKSIDDAAFELCSNLTSVTLPQSLTDIASMAFVYCENLKDIVIPSNVTSIGRQAFDGCSSLTSITCHAAVPPVIGAYSTFTDVDRSIPVYVPSSSVSAYNDADYWNEFTNIQPMPETININQYGSATYCSEYALDFSEVEGLKAYAATGYKTSTGVITLTRVMTANAGVGLFLKGDPGEYTVPVLESTDENSLNLLVGTLESTEVNSTSNDGLYANFRYTIKDGDETPLFYRVDDGYTLGAGKAYLQIPVAWMPAEAKSISLRFDDGATTDIENDAELENPNSELEIYDLMGRRVSTPQRGSLYLINGKKIIY